MSGPYPFYKSMGQNDPTPGIPFHSAAWRNCSSFEGVLKMAGEVVTGGLARALWMLRAGVKGNGRSLPGHMKDVTDATDEKRVETADNADISSKLQDMELCAWFWEPSDDL